MSTFSIARLSAVLIVGMSIAACEMILGDSDDDKPSDNQATLSSLTIKHGDQTSTVTAASSKITIGYGCSSFTATPMATRSGAAITINSIAVASAAESEAINALVGDNDLEVVVDGTKYQFTVYREDPLCPPSRTILGTLCSFGTDGVIGGGDDYIKGWGYREFDAAGRYLYATSFVDDPYMHDLDGIVRSGDEMTRFYDANDFSKKTYEDGNLIKDITYYSDSDTGLKIEPIEYYLYDSYDAYGRTAEYRMFNSPGDDNTWFTADDKVGMHGTFAYIRGQRCGIARYPGSDAVMDTSDDTLSYKVYEYNGDGQLTLIQSVLPGTDGIPFTADDTLGTSKTTRVYDSHGKKVESKSISSSDTTIETRSYDDQGRLVSLIIDSTAHGTDATHYFYDEATGLLEREEIDFYGTTMYYRFRLLEEGGDPQTADLPSLY